MGCMDLAYNSWGGSCEPGDGHLIPYISFDRKRKKQLDNIPNLLILCLYGGVELARSAIHFQR